MATNITKGQTGSSVSQVQKQLDSAGFSPGKVDGAFGPKTDSAVRAFQQSQGLKADGIVGPLTQAALNKANKTISSPTVTTNPNIVRSVTPGSPSEQRGVIGYGAGGAAIYGPGGAKAAETIYRRNQDGSVSESFGGPAGSSDIARGQDATLGSDISGADSGSDGFSDLSDAHNKYLDFIDQQAQKLRGDYQENVNLLNKQFDKAQTDLGAGQAREQAITGVKLQRIGGYLGETGSAMGVTSNQIAQHRNEMQSLALKRAEALNAAKNAYTKADAEYAAMKMKEAKEYEATIYERRKDFIEMTNEKAKEAAAAEKAKQDQDNKLRDDARTVLNTMISSFGGFDFDSMDEVTLKQVSELADVAGFPLASLKGPTLTQTSQASTERQRAISNAISQANLSLSRQRLQNDMAVSASEAKTLGVPISLVGMSEKQLMSQLSDDNNVPSWFIDFKYPGGVPEDAKINGIPSNAHAKSIREEWTKFRTQVSSSSSDNFLSGIFGGSSPQTALPTTSETGGESDYSYLQE